MEAKRKLQIKMENLLKLSSNYIVDRFLTDKGDEEDAFLLAEDFYQRLTIAAEHKSLVVLQVENKKNNQVETISGWVLAKRLNGCQAIIKLLDTPFKWQIIDINSILKMSHFPDKNQEQTKKRG